uniref:Alpha-N-acetylneuraminide alpha-2,8-sialyltransferase-like isoform X1 n=2 Tax=Pogona vitticeps TaxID=103695 RepID=A0ABM5EIU9_9SAUR
MFLGQLHRAHLKEPGIRRRHPSWHQIPGAMALEVRLRKKNLALVVCVVLLASLTLSLLQRTKREEGNVQRRAKCNELYALFQAKNLSGSSTRVHMTASDKVQTLVIEKWQLPTKDRIILEHLVLSQECHWEPDAVAVAKYREELRECCNASFWLVATKENTPLGSHIILDGDKGQKLSVKSDMWNLLPERSPFSDFQYKYCAVVGNGGILQDSHCGQEIDQADLVVRFNLPPMNYSDDVGTKTNLVTVNPSILTTKFKNLLARRKPFVDALRPYGDALFLIPSFSFVGHSDLGYRALYTMEDFGLMHRALFVNPQYLGCLSKYWKKGDFQPRRLSSGFMFVNMALEFCQRITLYGFWPFPHGLEDQAIPHHYYDDALPKPGVHAMPAEFSKYLGMYTQGALHIRLGKCK